MSMSSKEQNQAEAQTARTRHQFGLFSREALPSVPSTSYALARDVHFYQGMLPSTLLTGFDNNAMNGDKDLQQHLWLGQWVLLGPLKRLKSSIHRRCATLTDKKWLQDASSTVRRPPLQNHLQRRPRDGATFACQRPTPRRRSKPQS